MDIYKKLGIIIAVSVAVLIFAGFYNSSPLSEKVIVLSIGIDCGENGDFYVSYEAARASEQAQGEASSSGGGVITGRGPTLSMALQDASERTGKLVSLGQSSIIIIGEDYFRQKNVAQVLSYFSLSDAFRDGTCVAACRGSARELLNVSHAFSEYIGLMLDETIQRDGEKLSIPYVNVVDFSKMQLSENQSSYLPLIEFEESASSESISETFSNSSSSKKTGRFLMEKTVLFNGGGFIGEGDKSFTETLVFLTEENSFHTYPIDDYLSDPSISKKAAVGIVGKRVNYDCRLENDRAVYGIDIYIKVKRLRTDTDGSVSRFTAKSYGEITQANKITVQNEVRGNTESFFADVKEKECDIAGIYSAFYKKLGRQWKEFVAVHSDWLKNMEVRVAVEASN